METTVAFSVLIQKLQRRDTNWNGWLGWGRKRLFLSKDYFVGDKPTILFISFEVAVAEAFIRDRAKWTTTLIERMEKRRIDWKTIVFVNRFNLYVPFFSTIDHHRS
jgi:hypothetical protein